ncbi:MAG: MBL fold metallo-hydrolase [Planctomycetia bacterium]|nr:MBL fold metallo-hydrolase [Planctomycetia bacterium]
MNALTLTVIVNDKARQGYSQEHGLAVAVRSAFWQYLYDTGAGDALKANAIAAGLREVIWDGLILSHGHYDHTGALATFLRARPQTTVYHGQGVEARRYSCPAGSKPRDISLPEEARAALAALPEEQRVVISTWTQVDKGLFLTGPIPHEACEDCGGPFFQEPEAIHPDLFNDELALVIQRGKENVLLTGCCHSGLLNTLNHCRTHGFAIDTVVGGLHLKNATAERLAETADYLNEFMVRRIYLMHCTGEAVMQYLKRHCTAPVFELQAGDSVSL